MNKNIYLFYFMFFLYGLPFLKAQTKLRSPANDSTFNDSIISGGIYRKYVLYVPAAYYNNNDTVPLVFNIHGGTGNGNQQMQYGDFRPIADTANFIVIHPSGLNIPPLNYQGWNVFGSVSQGEADRKFIVDLMDALKNKYNIDSNRVYSAGFSQGGFMSYVMAGFNNNRFAAVASVSGSLVNEYFQAFAPTRPTPVMAIHGTSDGVIAYDGDGAFKSIHIDSLMKCWINYNGCNTSPVYSALQDANGSDGSTVERYLWQGGTQGVEVELYKVISGQHAWPSDVVTGGTIGTATRNMDFNASKTIWEFFRKYSLTSPATPTGPFAITSSSSVGENTSAKTSFDQVLGVAISPNPSDGNFRIILNGVNEASLFIYNMMGQKVFEKQLLQNQDDISLGNFPSGVYYYIVVDIAENLLQNQKLVIN